MKGRKVKIRGRKLIWSRRQQVGCQREKGQGGRRESFKGKSLKRIEEDVKRGIMGRRYKG